MIRSVNRSIAFSVNANQARPKHRMCGVGMTCSPKWIFSQKILIYEQTCTSYAKMVPSKDNANFQASGLVAHARHSASLIRGLFQLQWSCLHFQRHGYSGAIVWRALPMFHGAWENGYEGVYVFMGTIAVLHWMGSKKAGLFVCEDRPRDCNRHQERIEVG